MVLGPFNYFHIERIKEELDKINIDFAVLHNEDAQKAIKEADLRKPPGRYSAIYQSSGDFLYVDIDDHDEEKVVAILSQLGVMDISELNTEMQLDEPEYHCTECDYRSENPGLCPHHNKKLLEFSEWVADSKANPNSSKWSVVALAVFIFGLIYIAYFRRK